MHESRGLGDVYKRQVLAVPPKCLEKALKSLRESGYPGFPMGNVVKGDGGVVYDHPPEGYPTGLR